jgi:glycosyltransferase involved in cell wall biosynthesis
LKILHLNYFDNIGGAGIAVKRLHNEFLDNGFDSKILVFNAINFDKNVISTNNTLNKILDSIFIRLESIILKIYKPYIGAFSLNLFGTLSLNKIKNQKPDIIYIHWINNSFISINLLKKVLKLNIPTFIFLHDMWFLTGGCHHSFDCIKYIDHCHTCINLNSKYKYDLSYRLFKSKKNILQKYKNYKIIAPSKWIATCATQSAFFKYKTVVKIPNFVDMNVFKKLDKSHSRKILNINLDTKIILFGADMANTNPYKGWSYLKESLNLLECNYNLITFGSNFFDSTINGKQLQIKNFGKIHDHFVLALLYNAADVFVIPSLAEAFGQTAIESMSCGTPVVAFNIGGLKDIIIHKKNGYIANYKDTSDFSNGINWVLNENDEHITNNCIKFIANNFSSKIVFDKHLSLIKTIIDFN